MYRAFPQLTAANWGAFTCPREIPATNLHTLTIECGKALS
jgi:hypothetical protein